mmetsp:Transcript_47962/g.104716  ORF Transcript_47962/g.104716 Transcript_47962/m.104716 type:complete len:482 (+) Transcript_47962:31-1476(+)
MASQDLDYYTVLGLQRTASDAEIRRAYLQQSRRWHPDKAHQNGITVREATSKFQLISVANETLSDPLARRTYDRRREQPRQQRAHGFGGFGFGSTFFNFDFRYGRNHSDFHYGASDAGRASQHGASTDGALTTGEVWKAFVRGKISEDEFTRRMRNCFSDYGDGPTGFYQVFQKLFKDKIFAAEDKDVSDDSRSCSQSPDFGTATTAWKGGPGPFYKYWSSFHTTQNFNDLAKDRSAATASSSSGSKQAQRSEAKKRQKALYNTYNRKVHTLVDLLQALDPRVKAEEEQQEKRAAEQHTENQMKLQAERARRKKELEEEYAARRRMQEEEDEDDRDNAESEGDFGYLGSGGIAGIFVVTPDGVVMTCEEAEKSAAQDAAGVVPDCGKGHKADDCVVESAAHEAEDGGQGHDGADHRATDDVEQGVGASSGEGDASTESSEPEVYRCEACRKFFKHVNQYESHLASKKHKSEYAAWMKRTRK